MKFRCSYCGFEYEIDVENFDFNDKEIQCPNCGRISKYEVS